MNFIPQDFRATESPSQFARCDTAQAESAQASPVDKIIEDAERGRFT